MIKILTFAKALSRRNEFILCESAAIRENNLRFSTVHAPPDIRRRAQVTTVPNTIVAKTDIKKEMSKYFKEIRDKSDGYINYCNDRLIENEKEMTSLKEQLEQYSQILNTLMTENPDAYEEWSDGMLSDE